MKPTSVIFLILAAILIVSGVIVCFIANGIAKNDGVELFCDYVDGTGNAVTEYDISGKKITRINIDLKDVDVNVVGNSAKTFIKVENYPNKAYEYWVTDGTINFKPAGILSIFTSFRINESGFGFNGLRHYLGLGKYKDMQKTITIYLSPDDQMTSIDVNVRSGNVKISDLSVFSSCKVNVTSGKITLDRVGGNAEAEITCASGGLVFEGCTLKNTVANVTESGTIDCLLSIQHSFTLKCDTGNVYLDSSKCGTEYYGVYPSSEIVINKPSEGGEDKEPDEKPQEGSDDKKDDAGKENEGKEDEKTVSGDKLPVEFRGNVKIGDIRVNVAH